MWLYPYEPWAVYELARPGGLPKQRTYDPEEILVVVPEDWWRALPANTATGYAERVVEVIEGLYPDALEGVRGLPARDAARALADRAAHVHQRADRERPEGIALRALAAIGEPALATGAYFADAASHGRLASR